MSRLRRRLGITDGFKEQPFGSGYSLLHCLLLKRAAGPSSGQFSNENPCNSDPRIARARVDLQCAFECPFGLSKTRPEEGRAGATPPVSGNSRFTERSNFAEARDYHSLFSLLSCSKCRSPILVRQTNIGNMADGDKWDTPQLVYPTADLRVNPNAPRDIRLAFDEACNCYRAGAFTASAIMCRKTLEGICAAHGVTEGSLARSLRKMHEQNLIDGRLFEWSDLMRAAGNEAAHGVGLSIEQADAKDILEFTNAIMDYLFSFRDRFEEFKKRRNKEAEGKA